MPERLVVCLRFTSAAVSEPGLGALLGALAKRAVAHGAHLVGWHAGAVAFDFAPDALEDAIALLSDEPLPEGSAAGVAQGELTPVVEGAGKIALSVGPALGRATALSHLARSGEVVVDPELAAVKSGELSTSARRVGKKTGLLGLCLELAHPLRSEQAASVARLAVPERVGAVGPEDLPLFAGALSVVEANPGNGGSRLLDELAALHHAPFLQIAPHPVGEPLGALRHALLRDRLRGAAPNLVAEQAAACESLLAGEGLDLEGAASLIVAWLADGSGGLVLVDDAGDVDADTLEAVAAACSNAQLGLVVRLARGQPLPPVLSELEFSGRVELNELAAADAVELACSATGGALEPAAALELVSRAEASPLAVSVALASALDSSELVWNERRIVPRWRPPNGPPAPAADFIRARLGSLENGCERVLFALSVLGGEAEAGELSALVREVEPELDVERALAELERTRWVMLSGELVTLPSRTHQRTLLASISTEELLELHRAAAVMLESSERPLATASAALHALLGGRGDEAERLASRAAACAHAVGLVKTAEALEDFALTREHAPIRSRGLSGSFSWQAPVASRAFAALIELGPESEAAVSGRAAHALRQNDLSAIDQLVASLRASGEQPQLADRLEALSALARGEMGNALRLLRGANERAKKGDPQECCRAALGLAIGLAAAGREQDALLETLRALAKAREVKDPRGERACARMLSQLSRGAGDERAAQVWDDLIAPA